MGWDCQGREVSLQPRSTCGQQCPGQVATCPQAGQEWQQHRHPLPGPCVFSSLRSCHPLLPPHLLWDSPATSVLLVHTRRGAAWCAGGTPGACVPMHMMAAGASWGALHCRHSLRECGVTRVPWGCRCVRRGCAPSLRLGSSGCQGSWAGCPLPEAVVGAGRMGLGDRYRPACRLRLWFPAGAGGGGEPGGGCWGASRAARACWAPPGVGMMAATRLGPRPRGSAGQGWGGCSRGDASGFLGGWVAACSWRCWSVVCAPTWGIPLGQGCQWAPRGMGPLPPELLDQPPCRPLPFQAGC